MKYILPVFLFSLLLISCNETKKESQETDASEETKIVQTSTQDEEKEMEQNVQITPISHATMVIDWDNTIIYVDPVGGTKAFANQPTPTIVLLTDIHGDHLNVETLEAINKDGITYIAPQAVMDKLPKSLAAQTEVMNNDEAKLLQGFSIDAIPMYNLREEAKDFHVKGRGNGYVLEKDGHRVYISGDTEDIPEMRSLTNINEAFVCMNLPYTMTVESAADAVLDFEPDVVYPYHYRGKDGLSDIDKFKSIVTTANKNIEVKQLNWYPNQDSKK
ncbi:MBL fold metallo-hydrolase [Luteirhabdus pelagi]|uniref:MBL fold metallo-hydrolase n=1 Tax=Luteirhabdus pelagi TaxID=2792783 RepID=UPI0019396D53|nr:MBL fold metallo-hydrolase [Luteirhabdus pelagi]